MPRETTEWDSVVRALLYHVQFEPAVDDAVARRVATALIEDPLWQLTPDREYEILAAALRSRNPLPPERPSNMDDGEVLAFLSLIVSHMDALRPWPVRDLTVLPEDRLAEFASLGPIATVNLTVDDIEDRLDILFDFDEDYGDFLLLRVKSGTEVGLLSPLDAENGRVDVVGTPPAGSAREVLDELAAASNLDRASFVEPT
ncbi:hypothetical protein [Nocardia rhamnosiphila]